MPVEVKPLFRPDVLRPHLAAFALPPVDRAPLHHWAGEISSGRINRFGEQEILPHFAFLSRRCYDPWLKVSNPFRKMRAVAS